MNPNRPRRAQTDDDDDTSFPYPPNTRLPQTTYGQKFPPHPSVRIPSNVKKLGPPVRSDGGVTSPPTSYSNRPVQSVRRTQNEVQAPSQLRPPGSGKLVQGFKFPQAPPPVPRAVQSKRSRDVIQSPPSRFNMHDSYVSSIADDSTTTGTAPSTKPPRLASARIASSVYPDSEILKNEEYDGYSVFDDSKPSSPASPPTIVRQASMGKRGKPALTTIKNPEIDQKYRSPGIPSSTTSPTSNRSTINALSAAVAAGLSSKPQGTRTGIPNQRTQTPVRMPFENSKLSSRRVSHEELQPPELRSDIPSNPPRPQIPSPTLSTLSSNPLLGLGIDESSMSSKNPMKKRPPRLDMEAIREAENRGSTTSLVDLIRRATKLAANLDRGRTASKLGMLDMFGSTEKLGKVKRDSDMSDMISAFPAPANGGTPRRDAHWPLGEKGLYYEENELKSGRKGRKSRRYCGMSLMVLVIVIMVFIVIASAAILIPIFLVLEPRSEKGHPDLTHCASSYVCRNGGTSVVSNSTCNCVCSNGFIGDHCDVLGDSGDCTTMTVSDGTNKYDNATMGSSVLALFTDATTTFNVPLNTSTILSLFAVNNLSCESENALVDFNSSAVRRRYAQDVKRFIMLPEFGHPDIDGGKVFNIPHHAKRAANNNELRIEVRQDGTPVGTSNGIVFQATATPNLAAVPTGSTTTGSSAAGSAVSTITSLAPSNTPTPSSGSSNSSSPSPDISQKQIVFAKIVVMYVLQQSNAISVAVNAQQRIEGFFEGVNQKNSDNQVVDVGYEALALTADFGSLEIKDGQGNVLGGLHN